MQQVSAPVTQMTQLIPEVPSNIREGYHGKVSKCLGVTQIGIGATCIILQVVLIAMSSSSSVIGHGVWCGIFFIIGGSFGVAAGQTKRRGLIITFMVLSILSAALFISALIACSAIGIVIDGYEWRYSYNSYYSNTGTYSGYSSTVSAMRYLNGLLIGLGLLQGIIAIVSSAICCGATCCAGTATGTMYPQGLVTYPHTTGQQFMVMTGMGGQYQIPGQTTPQYITHPHSYTVQPGMQSPDQPSASVQQAAVPPTQFYNPPQIDSTTPDLPAVN